MRVSRILLVILGILLYAIPIYAQQELKIKAGYSDILCDGVGSSPVIEGSYELKNSLLGVEVFGSFFAPYLYSVAQIGSIDIGITPKVYWKGFYLGGGVGYIYNTVLWNTYSDELSNEPKTTIDNEFERHIVIGKDFKLFSLEIKRTIADLSVETGLIDFEPQIEKRSRLDNWQVVLIKRWKF